MIVCILLLFLLMCTSDLELSVAINVQMMGLKFRMYF